MLDTPSKQPDPLGVTSPGAYDQEAVIDVKRLGTKNTVEKNGAGLISIYLYLLHLSHASFFVIKKAFLYIVILKPKWTHNIYLVIKAMFCSVLEVFQQFGFVPFSLCDTWSLSSDHVPNC